MATDRMNRETKLYFDAMFELEVVRDLMECRGLTEAEARGKLLKDLEERDCDDNWTVDKYGSPFLVRLYYDTMSKVDCEAAADRMIAEYHPAYMRQQREYEKRRREAEIRRKTGLPSPPFPPAPARTSPPVTVSGSGPTMASSSRKPSPTSKPSAKKPVKKTSSGKGTSSNSTGSKKTPGKRTSKTGAAKGRVS